MARDIEALFRELIEIELILERLREGKAVRLLPNKKTKEIISTSRNYLRRHLEAIYNLRTVHIELRKPDSKMTERGIRKRRARDRRMQPLMDEIFDYLENTKDGRQS
jgi:hypothetical protein